MLLQRVGQVLLQHPATQIPKPQAPIAPRWLVAKDAFAMADAAATQAIYDALAGARFGKVQAVLGAPIEVEVAGDALAGDGLHELGAWVEAFRITQVGLACDLEAGPQIMPACVSMFIGSASVGVFAGASATEAVLYRGKGRSADTICRLQCRGPV